MTVIFILKPSNNYWLEVQLMPHQTFLETMTVSNNILWKLPEHAFGCNKKKKKKELLERTNTYLVYYALF